MFFSRNTSKKASIFVSVCNSLTRIVSQSRVAFKRRICKFGSVDLRRPELTVVAGFMSNIKENTELKKSVSGRLSRKQQRSFFSLILLKIKFLLLLK